MALLHKMLAASYYGVRGWRSAQRSLGMRDDASVRVLLYHDVPLDQQAAFASQLRRLRKSWTFITPAQFAAHARGEQTLRGRNLLLTFDDGFASNRRVAEQVLKPLGISALFFVISDFVSVRERAEAQRFIAQHIQPGVDLASLPEHLYNMSWADLESLLEQGHTIGAHTATHARLSTIAAPEHLEREIVASGDALARRLGVQVEHFAYTFGDLASFSRRAFECARGRYPFIYSGLRGDNAHGPNALGLWRDAIMPTDSHGLVGAFVEGIADFRYAPSRAELASWK